MSAARKLLQAASEIVGGDQRLAECLGIGEALLAKFISGRLVLPDALLLHSVDIVLRDRQGSRIADSERTLT